MKNTLSEVQSNLFSKEEILKFTSFDEANETEAKSSANITGIENLRNATELIKKVYSLELKSPMIKSINF